MRVLASADLHGVRKIYIWLVDIAAQVRPDIVALAGDLLGCPEGYDTAQEAQRADASEIVAILSGVTAPLFYIMGNDDLVALDPKTDAVRSIHGERVDLGDVNFVGYQFSLPFMGGVYEKPEEEIRNDLALMAPLVDRRTVLVTHSPAHGILDVGISDTHIGSVAIRELTETRSPLVHIHGHVHEGFGRHGSHFNVAAGGHYRAVLIDTDRVDGYKVIKE